MNIDIDDDAEDESQVDERLDIKTIERILLRIESSISSMGNRLIAVEQSQLDDSIQFQMPQRGHPNTCKRIAISGVLAITYRNHTCCCYYCTAGAIGSSFANYNRVAKSARSKIFKADTVESGHSQ